jgi:hypothetical protein
MSKLMLIIGIIVLAAGIALGLMVFFSPGRMQVVGLTADTAAILLTAGLLSIGLGGVIAAVETAAKSTQDLRDWLAGHEEAEVKAKAPAILLTEEPEPAVEPATAAVTVPVVAETAAATEEVTDTETAPVAEDKDKEEQVFPPFEKTLTAARPSTEDTLKSLEKAKTDLSSAMGLPLEFNRKSEVEPEPESKAEPEDAVASDEAEAEADAADADDDEQLYVIEEKFVRGRPARVLSDGTVEAETDEGWMRFENTEHLEEYLDAVSTTKA